MSEISFFFKYTNIISLNGNKTSFISSNKMCRIKNKMFKAQLGL